MSMSDPFNDLESIWYHSEPSEVPYSQNQYLDRGFFATFYSEAALVQLLHVSANITSENVYKDA